MIIYILAISKPHVSGEEKFLNYKELHRVGMIKRLETNPEV